VRVHPLAPVVGLDIDGTLGDYHKHFVWFCNNIYYPHGALSNLYPNWTKARGEFEIALNLGKSEYRAAKLAYRMGGLKRCMPIFLGDAVTRHKDQEIVKAEVQHLRSLGIQVWICTTRPWLNITTVDPDTQYWLEHNVGQVDGLIYGEDKYADLIDIVGRDRVLGVVDDLPENIERAAQLGLTHAIRRGNHNQWWLDEQLHRANSGKDFWNTQHFSHIKDMTKIVEGWNNGK
jgi:FMN phosphatase YigB (HAD superfamily)